MQRPKPHNLEHDKCKQVNNTDQRWQCTDWGGKISQEELLAEAKRLRLAHWKIQKDAGVDIIPSNDFALYDQVLSHIQDFGVWFCPVPLIPLTPV